MPLTEDQSGSPGMWPDQELNHDLPGPKLTLNHRAMPWRGEKKNLKNDNSLRDLWEKIKYANICIIGFPEREERENVTENLFEEIMAKNEGNKL